MTELSRNALTDAENNLEIAREIWSNLSGNNSDHSGIYLTFIGPYLVVDDGGDSWLCETQEYQKALDSVVRSAIKGIFKDADEGYVNLCAKFKAMFSRNGEGHYNDHIPKMIKFMKGDLNESQLEQVLDLLGITQDVTP